MPRHNVLQGFVGNHLCIYCIDVNVTDSYFDIGYLFVDRIPADLNEIVLDSETGYTYKIEIPEFLKNKVASSQFRVKLYEKYEKGD